MRAPEQMCFQKFLQPPIIKRSDSSSGDTEAVLHRYEYRCALKCYFPVFCVLWMTKALHAFDTHTILSAQ